MMNDPGSSDESQIRVVFSGWESELSDLSIPVSNADGLNAVQPGGQGKHGGFRRGSGRKAQVGTLQCFWLLYALLDRGSKAYEHRQRKAFMKTSERKYMGQDAANRVPLNSFLDRLWDSFQSQPGAFSNHSCSWELQVLFS